MKFWGPGSCAALALIAGLSVYYASCWWERAYATFDSSELSPDGCIRVDTYNAFRVLPSVFHKIPDPDPAVDYGYGRRWDAAIFKRAYEVKSGELLGETIVFDPAVADNIMSWGRSAKPGRRIVEANGFPIMDSSHCTDDATLAKLAAFYHRGG